MVPILNPDVVTQVGYSADAWSIDTDRLIQVDGRGARYFGHDFLSSPIQIYRKSLAQKIAPGHALAFRRILQLRWFQDEDADHDAEHRFARRFHAR